VSLLPLHDALPISNGCGALSFTGNGTTDSYDSGNLPVAGGVVSAPSSFNTSGGNVGTNGNESNSGNNVTINGTLSSPNAGFGVCTAGNMTALSGTSLNHVTGGIIQLPQAANCPTPVIPPPGPSNTTKTA